MKQEIINADSPFENQSLRKQQIFRRYSTGELSLHEVAEAINKIQPPPPDHSWKQRAALAIASFLFAVLIPPWARRAG